MSTGKKVVINTGGGDAPGLNAVIEAVVMSSCNRNWEVYGSKNGYSGLLNTDELVRLTPEQGPADFNSRRNDFRHHQ